MKELMELINQYEERYGCSHTKIEVYSDGSIIYDRRLGIDKLKMFDNLKELRSFLIHEMP